MFRKLFESMPSIVDELKNEFKVNDNPVDVTTDEGIEKVRSMVSEAKEHIKYLKDNSEKDFWLSMVFDKNTLNELDNISDEILKDAEKKYADAHTDGVNNEKDAQNYTRPVLKLKSEDAVKAYDVVNKYIDTQISPRLPKDTTNDFINSIKESLVDFAAWLALNKA